MTTTGSTVMNEQMREQKHNLEDYIIGATETSASVSAKSSMESLTTTASESAGTYSVYHC